MKKKGHGDRLSELFRGGLSPEEAGQMGSELKKAGPAEDEIESINRMSQLIDNVPIAEPSSEMDRRFYETLANESRDDSKNGKFSLRSDLFRFPGLQAAAGIAAGIALFLLGWFMSSWLGQGTYSKGEAAKLSGEIKYLKEALITTMLNQPSTLERIKAVNMADEFENADERVIQGLLTALNTDNNDNVRLLSLEALLKYSDNPAVRQGLIESIKNQSSPIIQLRLAEVMIALDEKRAAPEFQKILTNAGLNYLVRNKINEAVTVLL